MTITTAHEPQSTKDKDQDQEHGPFYTITVDDVEHRFDESPVTGGQIMAKAGVSESVGLVLLMEDGTQRAVKADEEFDLKPGRRFKKRPSFRRG